MINMEVFDWYKYLCQITGKTKSLDQARNSCDPVWGVCTNLGPSLLWAVCAFTKALPRLVFFDFQDELHKRKKLDAKVLRLSKFKKQKDSEKVSSFSSHFVSLSFYCQLRKEPLVNSKYGGRESRLRMRVLD